MSKSKIFVNPRGQGPTEEQQNEYDRIQQGLPPTPKVFAPIGPKILDSQGNPPLSPFQNTKPIYMPEQIRPNKVSSSDQALIDTPMGAPMGAGLETPVASLSKGLFDLEPNTAVGELPVEGGTVVPSNGSTIPEDANVGGTYLLNQNVTGRFRLSNEAPNIDPYLVPSFDPNEAMYENGSRLSVEDARIKFENEQEYQQSRLRDRGVSYDQVTPEENTNAYRYQTENGPSELESIFVLGHNLADSIADLQVNVNLTTENSNIGDGTNPQIVLANEFNASPLNVSNAATESIAEILLSLGQNKLRGEAREEAIDNELQLDDLESYFAKDHHNIFGGQADDTQMGIEVNAFHGLLYSLTERKIRASTGTAKPNGTLGIGGQMLAIALEDAGYITKMDYQPQQMDTGVEKGPAVKAYMLTKAGLTAGKSLWKFKSAKLQRQGAQAASGNQMRSIGVSRTAADKSINDRAGQVENDLGTQLLEGWGRHAANATKVMDTDILDISSTMLASLNGEHQGNPEQSNNPESFVSRLKRSAMDLLNVNQKTEEIVPAFGADVETVDLPIYETQKFNKVRNDIINAQDLQNRISTHKTPVFQDPTTGRTYYMTYDSNGQESRVHRSAVRGMESNVDMTLMPSRLDNIKMTTPKQEAEYDNWLKGKGQPTAASRYVSYMIAMGNLLVRGSRDFTNSNTLNKLSGNVIREAAAKGRSLRKFIVLNGETQYEILDNIKKNPKRGVRVEGLSPAEQGDILYIMDQIKSSGNEKEYGSQMRAYLVAAQIEDAHTTGKTSLFLSLPTAADMKSAGRMFAAMDTMDVSTVSKVGLALDSAAGSGPMNVRDGSSAFPVGNPRMFYTESLKSILRSANHPKGGDLDRGGVDFDAEFSYKISTYLDEMFKEQGPTFSDMVAKLSLMVADYGKAVSQNTEEVAIFLSKAKKRHPDIFQDIEFAFAGKGFSTANINQFFEEAMWNTTDKIVNTSNSQTVKKTAQAMALFNIQPYFRAIRGMKARIGRNISTVLPDNYVEIQATHTYDIINIKGKPVDDPLRATEPKMMENGQTHFVPGIASAAVNAMGPAMGHYRETAAMALAFQMVVDRMGEGIFMDQVYDSITLEPEAAVLYEYYLNEFAIFEIYDVNEPVELHKAFNEEVNAKLRVLLEEGTMYLGDGAELSGWSTKMDQDWAALMKPSDKNVIRSTAFREHVDKIEEMMVKQLFDAQQRGIWRPKGDEVVIRRGRKFIPRPEGTKQWPVDSRQFMAWFLKHIKNPIDKQASRLYRDNRSQERKDFKKNMKDVFAKAFQKSGLPD